MVVLGYPYPLPNFPPSSTALTPNEEKGSIRFPSLSQLFFQALLFLICPHLLLHFSAVLGAFEFTDALVLLPACTGPERQSDVRQI